MFHKIVPALLLGVAAGQQLAVCENANVVDPRGDSGCNFPACKDMGESGELTCVYDESFCVEGSQEFIPADKVVDEGRDDPCTCVDILDYPSNIGVCMTNGVASPMVSADQCAQGGPVCPAGPDGHFTVGDTSSKTQFTACNLPCSDDSGHDMPADPEAFQGCEFFSTKWGAFATSPNGRMYPRRAAVLDGTLVMGGYLKSKGEPGDASFVDVELDFNICGPFTAADPTCASGTVVHEELTAYDAGGWDQYEVGIVLIDAATGAPKDIVSFGGVGRDGLSGMDAKGDTIAASGEFVGTFTVGDTTITNSNGADGGRSQLDGFVMATTAAGEGKWVLDWPTSTANSRATSVSIDEADGAVFAAGYSCDASAEVGADGKALPDVCHAVLAKLDGATGAPAWAKDFAGLAHFNRVAVHGDALYLSGKMLPSDGVDADLKTACAHENGCAIVARADKDGVFQWARTVEGAQPSTSYTGDVEFDADGLHLYVALDDATPKSAAVVSLDSGSPYAACVDDATGEATLEFAVDASQVVTSCPAGQTFVARDSADAYPASAAQTSVYCSGAAATSCVAKYHMVSGVPVWATTIPNAAGLAVTGATVHAVGYDGGDFGMVKQPNYGGSHMWLAELDAATGKGVSLSTGGGPYGSSRAYDAVADENGNLLIVGYTGSHTSTWGDLTVELSEDDTDREAFALMVESSGAKTAPACVASCTNLMETTTVASGSCFVDNICYDGGETAAKTNLDMSCQVCDASSPKAFVDGPTVGSDHCWIDGKCIEKDAQFTYTPRYSAPIPSDCRYCNPAAEPNDWSVQDGFNADPSQNPPNDCELVNVNPSPTPGGGAAPSPTAGPVDPATPSKQPTTTPGETTPKPTVPKGKSDGAAATGLGLVTAAVGILGALAL